MSFWKALAIVAAPTALALAGAEIVRFVLAVWEVVFR
jgi:hypothetical protein